MRYFVSIAKTGSMRRAAELNHISPAALSKAMRIFESEMGVNLFLENGRGISLSDQAKKLLPEIENVLHQVDSLKERNVKSTSTENVLKLATFEVFSTHFLSKIAKEFFPDLSIELYESIPGPMEKLIAAGKADLGLTYLPVPHPELDFLRLVEIEMGVYASDKLIKKHSLSTLPFVVPTSSVEGSPTRIRGLDGWPDDSVRRNIKYQVELMESGLGLCSQGLAAAFLPKFIVSIYNDKVTSDFRLSQFSIKEPLITQKTYVYLVKRKSNIEGTMAKNLARAVRKMCH